MKLPQLTWRELFWLVLGAVTACGIALAYDLALLRTYGPAVVWAPQWSIPNFAPMSTLGGLLVAFYDSEDEMPSIESIALVGLIASAWFWLLVGGIVDWLLCRVWVNRTDPAGAKE